MSKDSERRANNRAWPLSTPMMVSLDQRMALIAKNLRSHWMGRFILTLFMMLCLGVVWWSLSERLPLIQDSRAYVQKVHRMQSKIDFLNTQFSQKMMDKYQTNISQFEQSLMPDMESASAWLHDKIIVAKANGMELSYTLSPLESVPKELGDIRILPVMITLRMSQGHANMLTASTFLDSLVADGWRVDMISLNMKGESYELSQVAAIFHIWMRSSPELDRLMVNKQ